MRDRLYVHITWTTRGREPVINNEIAGFLADYLPAVCHQERAHLLELGVVQSHVHLVVRLHPTTALPRLMQRMKGGSSVAINRSGWSQLELRWAKGYNVHSVSPRGLPAAIEYVRNQHRRHPDEVVEGWRYGCRFTDIRRAAASAADHPSAAGTRVVHNPSG